MGTEENNPDRVFLPPTSRNPHKLSRPSELAQRQPPTAPQPQFRPPTTSGRHGVFLSYARSDGEAYANQLRQRLNQDLPSLQVWQDRPEIEGGGGPWPSSMPASPGECPSSKESEEAATIAERQTHHMPDVL